MAAACGGPEGTAPPLCSPGEESCECYGNGSCDGDLECRSMRCVAPDAPDPDGEGGAPGSDPGAGGEGGAEPQAGSSSESQGGRIGTGGGSSSTGGLGDSGGPSAGTGSDDGGQSGGGASSGGASSSGGSSAGGQTNGGSPSGGSSSGGQATGGDATGGSAMTGGLPFFDDFEDGNADGWDGVSWMVVVDDDGNHVYTTDPLFGAAKTNIGSSSWGDMLVELRFKFATLVTTEAWLSIQARVASSTDEDELHFRVGSEDNGGYCRLKEDYTGLPTSMGSITHPINTQVYLDETLQQGRWYSASFLLEGGSLTAYLDGVEVLTASGALLENGGIAFAASSDEDGIVYIDDVSVTTP